MAEPTRIHSAGVQCLGGEKPTLDIGTTNWIQHLNPHAGEVLILPFESAKYLVQNRPNQWQPLIVVPKLVATDTDRLTGLDTLDVAISTVWGITQDGALYWDDAGADGADVATVTYSNGVATFEGGYGQSVAKPMLHHGPPLKEVSWRQEGYERIDISLQLNRDGTGAKWVDVPLSRLRHLGAISHLSALNHPNVVLYWHEQQGGTMIHVEGATCTVHPDPPRSIVITYWHKPR